jgi:hypothetical protein|tara:strand:- start:811 stop:975 length:165 start_codon:yes stop_codon:yes gene_type:complete
MPTYTQTTIGDRKQPARKTAPQPKSGGSDAPKSKRKYTKKKMEYWNNRGKKNKK